MRMKSKMSSLFYLFILLTAAPQTWAIVDLKNANFYVSCLRRWNSSLKPAPGIFPYVWRAQVLRRRKYSKVHFCSPWAICQAPDFAFAIGLFPRLVSQNAHQLFATFQLVKIFSTAPPDQGVTAYIYRNAQAGSIRRYRGVRSQANLSALLSSWKHYKRRQSNGQKGHG